MKNLSLSRESTSSHCSHIGEVIRWYMFMFNQKKSEIESWKFQLLARTAYLCHSPNPSSSVFPLPSLGSSKDFEYGRTQRGGFFSDPRLTTSRQEQNHSTRKCSRQIHTAQRQKTRCDETDVRTTDYSMNGFYKLTTVPGLFWSESGAVSDTDILIGKALATVGSNLTSSCILSSLLDKFWFGTWRNYYSI